MKPKAFTLMELLTAFCLVGLLLLTFPCLADTTRPLLPLPTGSARRLPVQPIDPDHFTFVVSGDNRSTGRGNPMPPTAGQIFAELRLLQPAFVLWTGDSIYGSDETVGEAEAEYDAFLGLAAHAALPVYSAPGNHEIFDRPDLAALYETKMGRLYGSFDYGNTHIIALNTEEIGSKGSLGKEQMDWLKQDLTANRKAKHILVFMHHPLFPKVEKEGFADPGVRDTLHKLLVQNGVKYVFSGHEHLLYRSVHDGVNYWVSGGAGAPTDASPEEGGYQHYVLFEVNGENIKATVLQPWRLFFSVGSNTAEGAASGLLSNYNDADLSLCLELSANAVPKDAVASSSWTYKGKTSPLEAAIVPSRSPGVITVRVVVPKHRSALVTLRPKATSN
jgi:hypothetical protein